MNLLNLIKSLFYKILPSWLYYKIAFLIKERRLTKANKNLFNKNISTPILKILKKYKKHEKIFIFGGGSSIKELTRKNFQEISKHCSIGINMWVFHKFVTNYYMIELTNDKNLNDKYRSKILSLLKNKLKQPIFLIYKSPSVSVNTQNWSKGMNSKRVLLYEYIRPDVFKKNLKNEFEKTINLLLEKIKNSNVLTLGIGASVERAISLTLLLGYSKIILLGIDIKNTKYFWSNKDYDFKNLATGQKKNGPHLTARKRFGGLPVNRSILILDKLARQKFNSRILMTTNKSLLSLKLQKYKWKQL